MARRAAIAGIRVRAACTAVLLGALILGVHGGLSAQLISPGKLSHAHADLQGIRNCTQCHELRHSGISPELCLKCHGPLARRIEAGEGFHASLAEKDCATCHREHFGPDFQLIRLDTTTFDHGRTGWPLAGEHATSACHDCHKPEFVTAPDVREDALSHGTLNRTFLGLSTECGVCHAADSHHERQFDDRDCGTCHVPAGWKDASGFHHDQTAFRLSGAHQRAKCGGCHTSTAQPRGPPEVRYVGTPTACGSCHRNDSPHGSQFAGRSCAECHDTGRWKGAAAFDHGKARFALTGKHKDVQCARCHASSPGRAGPAAARYRGLDFATCQSCHEDPHHGAMEKACTGCHTTSGWDAFDRSRLQKNFDHGTTGFALKGHHADLPCASCHDAGVAARTAGIHVRFEPGTEDSSFPSPAASKCTSCHEDAHQGAFAARPDSGDCMACHGESTWVPGTFDAARHTRETTFPLEGAHLTVPCVACHQGTPDTPPVFRLGDVSCRSCHETGNPHGDQFGKRSCDECHTVATFAIRAFDHGKTGFPLEGAHRSAACSACHHEEETPDGKRMVRYRPLGRECKDCHGGNG